MDRDESHAPAARTGHEADAGALDHAFRFLHRFGPEFGTGLSNHGPMAAEALAALGRPAEAPAWARAYGGRWKLEPASAPASPLDAGDWRVALGRPAAHPEWRAHFERELSESHWSEVLATWLPCVMPAMIAAAAHGLIRTRPHGPHLEGHDTTVRRAELARALAYWSARYQGLPGVPGKAGGHHQEAALRHLPRLAEARRTRLVLEEFRALDELPAFVDPVDLVDWSRPQPLSELVQSVTSRTMPWGETPIPICTSFS